MQAKIFPVRTFFVPSIFQGCDIGSSFDFARAENGHMDADQIKRRLKQLGITHAEAADRMGIERTLLTKALNKRRRLQIDELEALGRIMGLETVKTLGIIEIPVIGQVSAGNWQLAIEEPQYLMPAPFTDVPAGVFGVVVSGDSMDNVLPPGSIAVIDPTDLDLVARGIYVVMNGDGEATIKRFMPEPARLEPDSSNPDHNVIFPGRDTFQIIGRVIWRVEKMR